MTQGKVRELGEHVLEVDSPAMRAVALDATDPVAELAFAYDGPTNETAPLGDGEVRRQIGLKLRAQDSCNVVYVMWRIEPSSGLVVSVKHNPGKRVGTDCGPTGYRTVQAERTAPLPTLRAGESHRLRAEMREERLTVRVDGSPVWEGDLGSEALDFEGPVGVRTDNGRFRFELAAISRGEAGSGRCPGSSIE